MADNIKIIGNITDTTTVSRYSDEDINLLPTQNLQENFGGSEDNIELYLYDIGGNLLNTNYDYLNYKLPSTIGLTPSIETSPNTTGNIQTTEVGITSTLATPTGSLFPIIEIDPVKDIQDLNYSSGEFRIQYNFFTNIISDYISQDLFVKEISPDRTEIRLASITLTNEVIESTVNSMIDEINNSSYYINYLLNFGNNKQYVTVNIALNPNPDGYEVLFKMYEPLPLEVQEKQTLWVVQEKVNPYIFEVNLDKLITPPPPPTLRGPNFNINIDNQGTVSTQYQNYQTLVSGLQSLQNNSYKQILNLLATQSVSINVDYTDFNNFSFFGSVYHRITNFYNKVKEIEDYNNFISTKSSLTSSTPSLILEINQYSSSINNIVSKFDGYENYLYFESSSYTWPKSGSLKPYYLLSTGSSIVDNWYTNLTSSAYNYDLNNYNNLEYAVPDFLKSDETNEPFLTFLNMVGHYFDNIWIYLQAITDTNLANNNLNYGISKDLVYNQLLSLGLKLYNSQAGENIDQYLIGANTGSSTWDNDTTITGSYLNNIPRKDLVSELYKRIYHNLPLLMKQKGTVEGLDNLMTIFGIPNRTYYTVDSSSFYTPTGSSVTSSILNVKEYGGGLKSNLIQGYNNDKVRIINNAVTESVLSSILSLQTYPTASSEFRENDMHYVDISFSPQSQIDTYISGAITSNNPTWSLDDFIGDPGYIYSSSYSNLDAQRKLYFETGVSGYAPFTASLLDYNGFIRLVEYFDNALFKMLADFVPERASLSTGVTFESPVLERNKVAYANPTSTTTQSVYTAEYSTSSISSDYGTFYNYLGGDKAAWYDGDISGSIVDINQYFEDNNNSYLGDWDVYNAQNPPTKSINLNTFLHSDWNVLLNNVSSSVRSSTRKHIEYIWGTTGSITSSAELQDSYLTLTSYNNSRYNGTSLYSKYYNDFTGPQYITGSDILPTINTSFINTLDWSTIPFLTLTPNETYSTIRITPIDNFDQRKILSFFTSLGIGNQFIVTAPNSNISLGNNNNKLFTLYRIGGVSRFGGDIYIGVSSRLDTGGSPTITQNISSTPTNFQKVSYWGGDKSYGKTSVIDRNSYKLGWLKNTPSQSLNFYTKTPLSIEYLVDSNSTLTTLNSYNNNLFEVQNIFKSGKPAVLSIEDKNQNRKDGQKLVWRGGYSFDPVIYRENGEPMTFRYDNYIYSQSLNLGFLLSDNNTYVSAINPRGGYTFASVIENRGGVNFFQVNGRNESTTYNGNTFVATRIQAGAGGQWPWNNVPRLSAINNLTFTSGRSRDPYVYIFDIFNFDKLTRQYTNDPNTADGFSNGFNTEPTSTNIQSNIYKVTRSSPNYKIYGGIQRCIPQVKDSGPGWSMFKVALIIERARTEQDYLQNNFTELIAIANQQVLTVNGGDNTPNYSPNDGSIQLDPEDGKVAYYAFKFEFDTSTTTLYNLTAGEYLRISFVFIDPQRFFPEAEDINLIFEKPYWGIIDLENTTTEYVYDSVYTSSVDFFSITSSLLPNDTLKFNNASSNYFYNSTFVGDSPNYSPIKDYFSLQSGDLIKFGKFKDPGDYYEVISTNTSAFPYQITLNNSIISGSNSNNFAVLRPKPDETSIILEGRNAIGIESVSTALLLPYDANNNLKNSVGDIIKSINPIV